MAGEFEKLGRRLVIRKQKAAAARRHSERAQKKFVDQIQPGTQPAVFPPKTKRILVEKTQREKNLEMQTFGRVLQPEETEKFHKKMQGRRTTAKPTSRRRGV